MPFVFKATFKTVAWRLIRSANCCIESAHIQTALRPAYMFHPCDTIRRARNVKSASVCGGERGGRGRFGLPRIVELCNRHAAAPERVERLANGTISTLPAGTASPVTDNKVKRGGSLGSGMSRCWLDTESVLLSLLTRDTGEATGSTEGSRNKTLVLAVVITRWFVV